MTELTDLYILERFDSQQCMPSHIYFLLYPRNVPMH